MNRVILFHWNSTEAAELVARIRSAGYAAQYFVPKSGASLRTLSEDPPEAFVIDLSRMPSHGLAVATALRQRKGTRHVPILFVSGEADKIARVRALLPDAVYTEWSRIRSALREALRHPPANPAVPGTMAGYASTPLPKKLGIVKGSRVVVDGAPAGFERTLGALPEGAVIEERGPADRVMLFVESMRDLALRFPAAARAVAKSGGLWIVWPKKTSGIVSDLSQTAVRAYGMDRGFVDYKICAVDETWSGLLFARRRSTS